ncbi:PilZ domain-containing protein [Leisingera aquaemixtae]|uniref:PilZ domain-containing protein n=1 Tax=Leisingera aquaemixtae TaxID=1396826 RepID=UPI003965813C
MKIPCTLNFPSFCSRGITLNISYSGMGVELVEESLQFNRRDLQSVTVEGVGTLEVHVIWRQGSRIGLKFVSKRIARPILDAFFTKIGDFPF